MQTVLNERIADVKKRIIAACGRVKRNPDEVRIMVVTKTHSFTKVMDAYNAGLRIFGENRVLEAAEKYATVPPGMELHLIGHLQTNKAKNAANLFTWVDSIDSLHTAKALNKRLEVLGKTVNILLEVNTSLEASKSGYRTMEDLEKELPEITQLAQLRLRGLMTLGPLSEDREKVRDAFRRLRTCMDRLRTLVPKETIDTLSMGMSGDFEIAVEEGSTLVRLGTVLLARNT